MRTIVYISCAETGFFKDQYSIDALVRFANANNTELGVSGYLLVAMPFFLQRLEGPQPILSRLAEGIKGDRRHKDFIIVEDKPISSPVYGNWAMRSFDTVRSKVSCAPHDCLCLPGCCPCLLLCFLPTRVRWHTGHMRGKQFPGCF